MDHKVRVLVPVLKSFGKINRQNSFFVYDLYRYFHLLEDLAARNKLSYKVFSGVRVQSFSDHLSYDQIQGRDWTVSRHAGTRRTRWQKIRFVDDEARESAQILISDRADWPDRLNGDAMRSFIDFNASVIQLHIRDIPTMVGAIVLFLFLREDKNKLDIVKKINGMMVKNTPKRQKEEKQNDEQVEGEMAPITWGKGGELKDFYIIKVAGARRTPGARCMDKTISSLKNILREEGVSISTEEKVTKKKLCKLLQNHLKTQGRFQL